MAHVVWPVPPWVASTAAACHRPVPSTSPLSVDVPAVRRYRVSRSLRARSTPATGSWIACETSATTAVGTPVIGVRGDSGGLESTWTSRNRGPLNEAAVNGFGPGVSAPAASSVRAPAPSWSVKTPRRTVTDWCTSPHTKSAALGVPLRKSLTATRATVPSSGTPLLSTSLPW